MTTIADELIAMKLAIESLPLEYRAHLRERYTSLSDAILNHLSLIMERDKSIGELVDQAKLDTQYITFDLEATKRERDDLKTQLGE
jgi:hypothetical protein